MYALVYFPTLKNYSVIPLEALCKTVHKNGVVMLQCGEAEMEVDVKVVGLKADLDRSHKRFQTNKNQEQEQECCSAKRCRFDDEDSASTAPVLIPEAGADAESCQQSRYFSKQGCSHDDSIDSKIEVIKQEVAQLRKDVNGLKLTVEILERGPRRGDGVSQALNPADIECTYFSRDEVSFTAGQCRSATAFARVMARKLFNRGYDKYAKVKEKKDQAKVEWLRKLCEAYFPLVDPAHQWSQWLSCTRAIDNYIHKVLRPKEIEQSGTVTPSSTDEGIEDASAANTSSAQAAEDASPPLLIPAVKSECTNYNF